MRHLTFVEQLLQLKQVKQLPQPQLLNRNRPSSPFLPFFCRSSNKKGNGFLSTVVVALILTNLINKLRNAYAAFMQLTVLQSQN